MDEHNQWLLDFPKAEALSRQLGKGILLQFHRDECAGCKKMYANTYPDADVERELFQWFIPVRQDITMDRVLRSQFSAYWTPSFFFLDTRGRVQHNVNGYLNTEDFRMMLRLGKAAIDMPRGKYFDVIDMMDDGLRLFPGNPMAAKMLFTRGMAEYLVGKEKSAFRGTMSEIIEKYPDSQEARMWPWPDRP